MGDVLELQHVTVRRGGRNIVDRIDWSVDEGERWVILGSNGAGKTSLIQLAGARLFPTTGQVTILGHTMGRTNAADLHPLIGLTSSALDARIPSVEKVHDVVRTGAYGVTAHWREAYDEEDDSRARGLLDALGVGSLADRTFGSISSGERKRVGVARALMPDPELLLLDEPASGLDLGGREELLSSLTALARDIYAPAMVLVTHHVEEIPEGFTHGLVLRGGGVLASGLLDDVLTDEILSECFGLALEVEKTGERYTARASRSSLDRSA
ncbi:ABC transporter ATP-binding protein [Flaviflexus equikiangi]|uniref:ABC transporter ATP-binding protein n=1 Tax=Flaviflexus equikiangi TaxID=2758573 RepID=A0ABS2THQ1_9ACTO|nr:ABC transporter ATP-binding protein [Flaviflexus equikiangi]MBM9433307.1 ABC transporter ATP-binding protein [Flaviflexus equikiangi]